MKTFIWLLKACDLGILPEKTMLGMKSAKKRAIKRVFWTLFMYFGVFLGVIGEHLLSLHVPGEPFDWSKFDSFQIIVALIITTVIFRVVYPKLFGTQTIESGNKPDPLATQFMLQFCIAFQNGFFWQVLIDKLK